MIDSATLLPSKKIATISLMGDTRVVAVSAYSDGALAIASMEKLGGTFRDWRKELSEKIESFRNKGFSILIETDSPYFAECGHCIRLDQMDDEERRTYQNIALDRYFSLQAMGDNASDKVGEWRGNIRMAKAIQRHWLQASNINITQDEKGRSRYDIEQSSLTGYHRALLLSVLAATHFNLYDENSLAQMMEIFGVKRNKTPIERVNNIFKGLAG